MKAYETVIVLKPELEQEAIDATVAKVTAIIENAGEVKNVDTWGKRKLAYPIAKKYNEGIYIVITFNAETSVLPELDHLYKISDEYLRNIIVAKEK